jgi:2-polyprenyl-6-hydroxyphenyl methylase/3-demethylubiquinone-9 3-methyltransferase
MPQLNVSKNKWEKEFSAGRWDYLDSAPAERARSAIIGMLCRYYYPKGKILDVGCGLGTAVDFLNTDQKEKYLGLDVSEEAIKRAGKKKMKFQVADFENFKSPKKFDVIIFNEVLYYMDENFAFYQALNILTKNGIIIVSLYQMKNKRYDKKIWKAGRKFFKTAEVIEVSSKVKKQHVTWRVGVLKKK